MTNLLCAACMLFVSSVFGSGLAQSLGWRGKHIEAIGTFHWGARPYEPASGRFLSHDSLFDSPNPGGFSLAGGDPVNFFDPSGRFGKQMGDPTSYDALANARDFVGEEHRQEMLVGFVNLVTFGIADPLTTVLTGYDLNGNRADRGQAANDLYLSVLLALPMLVPGAGEAGLAVEAGEGFALRVGEDALIGAGERGLTGAGETAFSGGARQLEFGFAGPSEQAPVLTAVQAVAPEPSAVASEAVQLELSFASRGSANPRTQAAALSGTSRHADRPGQLPDQLRSMFPETEFQFTPPGRPGQDAQVVGGMHPSFYPYGNWPQGVNFGDFKPNTAGGLRTFISDQRNKWSQPTFMLRYDPTTGKLIEVPVP